MLHASLSQTRGASQSSSHLQASSKAAGTAGAKYMPASYYRYWITAGGTVRTEGDLNGDGLFCDGWEASLTDIMAQPSQYSVGGCSDEISFSLLDNDPDSLKGRCFSQIVFHGIRGKDLA